MDGNSNITAWVSVETTGLETRTARIIKLDILVVSDKKVLKSFNTYINPTIPIPQETTEYNGITDDMVASAPLFAEVANDVSNIIKHCSAIGGDSVLFFDLPVLMAEFERLEMPFSIIGKRIIDTNDIYRKYCRHGLDEKLRERLGEDGYGKLSERISSNNDSYNNDAFKSVMLYRSLVKDFAIEDEDVDEICGNNGRIDLAGFFIRTKDNDVLLARGKYKGMNINDVDPTYFSWMATNENLDSDTRNIASRVFAVRTKANL